MRWRRGGTWDRLLAHAQQTKSDAVGKVERRVNRLKQWQGIATRYEKRAANYRAAVVITPLVIWLTP